MRFFWKMSKNQRDNAFHKTKNNVQTSRYLLIKDTKFSLRTFVITTGIPRKTCLTWILHELSDANRELRYELRYALSDMRDDIFEDELLFFFQAIKTKRENFIWLPRRANALLQIHSRLTLSTKKIIPRLAFTRDKNLSVKAVEHRTIINFEVYVVFCCKTGERWRNPSNILIGSMTRTFALKPKIFFKYKEFRSSSSYSDFNLCDRWLLRELKRSWKLQFTIITLKLRKSS